MAVGCSGTVHQRHILASLVVLVLALAVLIVTPVILGHTREDKTIGNSEDKEQPEQVERLQCGQQGRGDELGEPALVLTSRPVQHVGSHSAELGEDGENDFEVQIVA